MKQQDKSLHTTLLEQRAADGTKTYFLQYRGGKSRLNECLKSVNQEIQGHQCQGVWIDEDLANFKPAPQVTDKGTTRAFKKWCEEHGHWSFR
jgi:hypothetical protein